MGKYLIYKFLQFSAKISIPTTTKVIIIINQDVIIQKKKFYLAGTVLLQGKPLPSPKIYQCV